MRYKCQARQGNNMGGQQAGVGRLPDKAGRWWWGGTGRQVQAVKWRASGGRQRHGGMPCSRSMLYTGKASVRTGSTIHRAEPRQPGGGFSNSNGYHPQAVEWKNCRQA